tara:strand:- start:14169 stop:14345 length:177 start_codon:yes stop_codon:yes gene_type:complete
LLGAVFIYITFAFILSVISTSPKEIKGELEYDIFAQKNGMHTDVIIDQEDVRESIRLK